MTQETADVLILALWFTAGACCVWCVPDAIDILAGISGNRRIGNARSRAASREARRRRELGLD